MGLRYNLTRALGGLHVGTNVLATPPSGEMAIYAKSDGFLYRKDSAGTETMIGSTGPGSDAPVGAIFPFAGSTAPAGFMIADGSAISRTMYAELFAMISTTYGPGDGSTTFNLPNLKGRVLVGRDAAQTEFDVLGETGGAKTHTLGISEIPAHNHDVPTDYGPSSMQHMSGATGRVAQTGTGASGAASPLPLTGNTGTGGPHNNLQPYIVGNYIIKVSTIIGGLAPNQMMELSTASPHTLANGWQKTPITVLNSRPGSNMTYASNGVTINTSGWYRIDANVLWDGGTSGRRIIRIIGAASSGTAASGAPNIAGDDVVATTAWYPAQVLSATRFLVAGTHIRLEAYNDVVGGVSNVVSKMTIEALSSNPADAADTGWFYPTLLNSWVNFGGIYTPARYRKRNGIVYVEGLVKSGSINADVFILPAGFRPGYLRLDSSVDGTNTANGRLDIFGTGEVAAVTGNNAFFSLNTSFIAEQ